MIAMIIRSSVDGNVYEFIDKPNIWYIGKLLNEEQINALKQFNNTVISYKMLMELGEKKILNEIENLTGIKCIIKVHEHDEDGKAVIVWKKPEYELDTTSNTDRYILNIVNYGDKPVFVKSYLKLIRDGEGKVLDFVTKEEIKKWLKADGYTAVKFD